MKALPVIALLGFLISIGTLLAGDTAPAGHIASPDVYKLITENAQFRFIRATWQPGQEDDYHSHTADRVSIFETDCKLRLTARDGKSKVVNPKAGKAKARTGEPVKAHKAKNLGDKICVITIVEKK